VGVDRGEEGFRFGAFSDVTERIKKEEKSSLKILDNQDK
jgi:hypothetical protein